MSEPPHPSKQGATEEICNLILEEIPFPHTDLLKVFISGCISKMLKSKNNPG